MYNFLGLVNNVNASFNETPLTSSDFATAGGYYNDVKKAVNKALIDIHTHGVEWPFNHTTAEVTLTPYVVRYAYPADCSSLMLHTFRVKENLSLGHNSQWLFPLDYESYLQHHSNLEDNPTNYAGTPMNVFRTPNLEWGIVPPPDKEYVIKYEYVSLGENLVDWDDVPSVPERFSHVIDDGALRYANLFRGDVDTSELKKRDFDAGLKKMRSIFINRYEYARSTQIF